MILFCLMALIFRLCSVRNKCARLHNSEYFDLSYTDREPVFFYRRILWNRSFLSVLGGNIEKGSILLCHSIYGDTSNNNRVRALRYSLGEICVMSHSPSLLKIFISIAYLKAKHDAKWVYIIYLKTLWIHMRAGTCR